MKLKWRHNNKFERWELKDPRDEVIYGPNARVLFYINDEYLARSALAIEDIDHWVHKRTGYHLPNEAYP